MMAGGEFGAPPLGDGAGYLYGSTVEQGGLVPVPPPGAAPKVKSSHKKSSLAASKSHGARGAAEASGVEMRY